MAAHRLTPLPDNTYSSTEKAVIWTAIGLGLAVLAGLMLAFDTVWTTRSDPSSGNRWSKMPGLPATQGTRRPGDLHPQHAGLRCSAPALFRKWKLPTDERMTMALIAWVCLAPVLRVRRCRFSLRRKMCCSSHRSSTSILRVGSWVLRSSAAFWLDAGDDHHGDAAQEAQATVLGGLLFVALMGHWYLLTGPLTLFMMQISWLAGVALAAAVLWATIVWTRPGRPSPVVYWRLPQAPW